MYTNEREFLNSLVPAEIADLARPSILNSFMNIVWFISDDKKAHSYTEKLEFDFDVKLKSGINLQRGLVWTQKQKEQFIISVLSGMAVPNVVVNIPRTNQHYNVFKVIDGKQRLTTCISFLKNEFSINGFFADDVIGKSTLGQIFTSKASNAIKFETYYDDLTDSQLVALFEKVNFLGTPQEEEHLSNLKNALNK